MGIYWVIYGLLVASVIFDVRYSTVAVKRFVLVAVGLIFALFRGLRWETGTDWEQYLHIFNSAGWENIFSFHRYGSEYLEFGFVLLNAIFVSLFGNYTVFLIVINSFILYSYANFSLKFSAYPIIAFSVIILTYGFFPVRQNLAIAIALFSFPYFFRKQHLVFSVIVLAAFSVHASAIVFLFTFFLRSKLSVFFSLLLITISFFIGEYVEVLLVYVIEVLNIFGGVFSNRLLVYMKFFSNEDSRSLAGLFLSVFFYLLFVLNRSKVAEERLIVYNVFLNLYLLTIVISNLFSSYFVELSRIASLFAFSSGILIAELFPYVNKQNPKLLVLGYFFLLCYLVFRFYGWLDFFPERHFPYRLVTF
jgi:hypothetical protein